MENNSNTRVVQLGDLLNQEQLDVVFDLITRIRAGSCQPETLKNYLRTQEAELLAKEVLPDYLYYSIIYNAGIY
jgi:hypothetical protein